jgi:hypothetical protein
MTFQKEYAVSVYMGRAWEVASHKYRKWQSTIRYRKTMIVDCDYKLLIGRESQSKMRAILCIRSVTPYQHITCGS